MSYKLKSGLVIAVLVCLVIAIGAIVGKGGSNLVFSKNPPSEEEGGFTGATVGEPCQGDDCPESCQDYSCIVACYSDEDCDDRIRATEDICKNPGTEFSLCVNRRN